MPEPLIQRLIEIQQHERLSNGAFAEKLGIDRSMWWRVRRSNQRAGRKVVDGALRCYPELAPLLAQDVQICPTAGVLSQGAA